MTLPRAAFVLTDCPGGVFFPPSKSTLGPALPCPYPTLRLSMPAKRKPSSAPPPARASSTAPPQSSSSSSSSDEEQLAPAPKPPRPQTPNLIAPANSSSSSDSSSDEEEEKAAEVKKVKSAARNPDSQPDNKKPVWPVKDVLTLLRSLSEFHAKHERLPSRKECGGSFLAGIRESISFAVTEDQLLDKIGELRFHFRQCVWTPEDVLTLLRALSDYRAENGSLPTRKDCEAFLDGISGFISFPVTEHKVFTKIGRLRTLYNTRKRRGHEGFPLRRPHDEAVHSLCKELFEHAKKPSRGQKRKRRCKEAANGGGSRSRFYLGGLIKEMMSGEQCLGTISTVEDAIRLIGESRVRDLEAEIKALRIDAIRLSVRKEELMSELFGILADEMTMDDRIVV